jgi:hypothetical protein
MVSFKTFGWRLVELFAAEQQDEPCVQRPVSRHLCFDPTLATQVSNQNKNDGQFSIQMF